MRRLPSIIRWLVLANLIGCGAGAPPPPAGADPGGVPTAALSESPSLSSTPKAEPRKLGLTPEQVRSVFMRRGYGMIHGSYRRALAAEAGLTGNITIMIHILPSGEVGSVRSETTMGAGMAGCVERALSRLLFASADGPTSATFPLVFSVEPAPASSVRDGDGGAP